MAKPMKPCASIRGLLFGGKHRMRRQTKDWHGFDSVTLYNGHDGLICTRCGNFDFILYKGPALHVIRATHRPTPPQRSEPTDV